MKTPPLAGPLLRVVAALFLCAACFQSGRWYQELAGAASKHESTELVSATFRGAPEPAPLIRAGDAIGQAEDIITPLNVRDPSALVMGPGGARECAPAHLDPEPPAKEVKPRKLKEGRLLELLKKADKKTAAPKNY